MKSQKLLTTALLLISLTTFTSCSDTEEALPPNTIVDSQGVDFLLEWSTGSTVTAALEEADLDMRLWKGETAVEKSDLSSSSFEEVELLDLYSDGDYQVEVDLYNTSKDVEFTLYIVGKESETRHEYTGQFSVSDAENGGASFPEFVTVTKTGTTYSISK